MQAETRLLFVYGTLMSHASSEMGRRERAQLDAAGRIVGPAFVTGQLFDLGAYPGFVASRSGAGVSAPATDNGRIAGMSAHETCGLDDTSKPEAVVSRVYGELRELEAPDAVFSWLDRYEGIDPVRRDTSEYRRIVCAATPIANLSVLQTPVAAWIYIYQGQLDGARLLPRGRWPS